MENVKGIGNQEGNEKSGVKDKDTPKEEGKKKKKKKKKKLPLTWAQLESYGHLVDATGQTLEVRAIKDASFMRQVFDCKDRVGDIRKLAVYTTAGRLEGLAPGVIVRWKNPRFKFFMDGSSGARVEDHDVANITIGDPSG